MNFKSEPSIVISNVDLDIDEKYVAKVVQNMGRVSRIIIDKRVGSKGNHYNRITIHFDFWYENASTVKPRSALLQGKKININHNVSDVWVAKALVLQVADDMRPYSVRRLDDKLCEQDVKQGFNDRRLKVVADPVIDAVIDPVIDMSIPALVIAPALGEIPTLIVKPIEQDETQAKKNMEEARKREENEETKKKGEEAKNKALPPLTKNPLMLVKMGHYFRSYQVREITDDMYRDNIQFIRDQMEFAKEVQEEEDTPNVDYGEFQMPPRRRRIVVVA